VFAIRRESGTLTRAEEMRMVRWLGAIVPGALPLTLLVATLPTMWPVVALKADLRVVVTSDSGGGWRICLQVRRRCGPPMKCACRLGGRSSSG
jgi:hypothetical protein